MLPQEIIRSKRDGKRLTDAEIETFVAGLTSGAVADAQAGAFAMAVYLRGMDVGEAVALTRAMTASGTRLRWDLPGPVVDKHSTGGVGDTVSLMLGPMVAACGGFVPMISGRGLGHTGGTYDKFESIPGYVATPTMAAFRRVVAKVGVSIIGQTADLAPADKRLYGVRDVTATVESIPLITASILSKKLAAGLDALVMDVKFGNGAFMASIDDARALAESITSVAAGAGTPTHALLTDMDQPPASVAGNALEVAYRSSTSPEHDVSADAQVVMALCAGMLVVGGLARSVDAAAPAATGPRLRVTPPSRFGRMVKAMGGPGDLVSRPWAHLERAGHAGGDARPAWFRQPSTPDRSVSPSSCSAVDAPVRRTTSTMPSGSPTSPASAIGWATIARCASCTPASRPPPPGGRAGAPPYRLGRSVPDISAPVRDRIVGRGPRRRS
ncbi:MAG: thymidine phosphorylase [Ilumatobacteraceae bacterium]